MDYIIVFMVGFALGGYVFRRAALLFTALFFGGLAFYYYMKAL